MERTEGSRGVVRLLLTWVGITANTGADFRGESLVLDFADGELVKTINPVTVLLNDEIPEETERLIASLRLAPGTAPGAKLGDRSSVEIEVIDDDLAASFEFTSDTLEVRENGSPVRRLFVERSGGLKGAMEVVVTTKPKEGGATPDVDYASAPLPLSFVSGQRLAQVLIPVTADDLYETNETAILELALAMPTAAGARLGNRRVAQITLLNDATRNPRLTFQNRAGSGPEDIHLEIHGPAGQRLGIETSTDLIHWDAAADRHINVQGLVDLPFDAMADGGRYFRIVPKP